MKQHIAFSISTYLLLSGALLIGITPSMAVAEETTTIVLNPEVWKRTHPSFLNAQSVCESEPLNGDFDFNFDPKKGEVSRVACEIGGSIPLGVILKVDNIDLFFKAFNIVNSGHIIIGENSPIKAPDIHTGNKRFSNLGEISLHSGTWGNPIPSSVRGVGIITNVIPGLGGFIKLIIGHAVAETSLNSGGTFINHDISGTGGKLTIFSGAKFLNVGTFENDASGTLVIKTGALFKNGIDHSLPIVDDVGDPIYSKFTNSGTVAIGGAFVNTDLAINYGSGIMEVHGIIINSDAHYDVVPDRRLPERTVTNIDGDGFINYGEIRIRSGGQLVNLPPAGSLIGDMIAASFEPLIFIATLGAGAAVSNIAVTSVNSFVTKVAGNIALAAVDVAGNIQLLASEVEEIATLDEKPQGANTDAILCDFIEQELVGLSYIENKGLIKTFDGGSILNYCWALINNDNGGKIENDGVFYNRGGMVRTGDFLNTGQFYNRNHDQNIAAGGAQWHWGGLILNSDHFQNKGHVENTGYFISGDPFINDESQCGQYNPYLDYHKTITECDRKMINGPGIVSNWEGAVFANLYYMGNKNSEIIISCDSDFINGPVTLEGTGTIKSAGTITNFGELPSVQNISGKCVDENSIDITDIFIGNSGDEEGDDIEYVASFTDTSTNDNWTVKFDFDDGEKGTASKDSKDKIDVKCGEKFVGFKTTTDDDGNEIPVIPLVLLFEPIFCFDHWEVEYSDDHRYGDDDNYKVKASVTHKNPSKIIASDGTVIYTAIGSDSRTKTFDIDNDNPKVTIDTIKCKDVYNPDACPPLDDVKPNDRYLNPINENGFVTITGNIKDNGWLDTFEDATINWGVKPEILDLELNDDYNSDGSGSTRSATQTFTATHKYGDNGEFTIKVCVEDDDGGSDCDTEIIIVNNIVPTLVLDHIAFDDENISIDFSGTITDPGSDDVFISWDWDDTHSDSTTYLLDKLGGTPDPLPSPSIDSRTEVDTQTHTWGDNGIFNIEVCVWDDDMIIDGTKNCDSTTVTINNVVPTLVLDHIGFNDENSSIDFTGTITDPGSDDVFISWDWDDTHSDSEIYLLDEPNTDPLPSPSIDPRDVTDSQTHIWGDNGFFNIEVCVWDDDMIIDGDQICEITPVTINNVSPIVEIDESELRLIQDVPTFLSTVNESIDFTGFSQDPGSDDLQFTWNWDDDTSTDVTPYLVNTPANDPLPSPSIQPRDVTDEKSHTYSEACLYNIELTIDEDDGAVESDSSSVVVVGNEVRTQPPGYWQTQASGLLSGKGKIDFTEYQFQCLLDIATHMSSFYGVQSSVSTIEESKDILAISKKVTERDLFDKDLLTAWLNYGIGVTDLDRPVDTDHDKVDDSSFSEIIDIAEAVRLDPSSTDAEIREQRLNIIIFYTSER